MPSERQTTRRSLLTALAVAPGLAPAAETAAQGAAAQGAATQGADPDAAAQRADPGAAAQRADPGGEVRQFVIGTGDPSGTYYPVGGALANILTSPPGGEPCRPDEEVCGVPGLLAVAQSTAGSVANIEDLASGRLDSAFAQADVAFAAYRGTGLFAAGDFGHLRALAALYPEVAQLVVVDPERSRPWRLAVGAPRSGTQLTASVVLPAFGLGPDDVVRLAMNPSAALAAMASGEADGFLTVAGVPTNAVAEALRRAGTVLVPAVPEAARAMVLERPHWRLVTLASALYGRNETVRAPAVPALWLVRDDLEADLVHALLAALWASTARATLDAGHPAGRAITLASALEGVSVPLHPAARRFYRERGLLAGGTEPLTPARRSPSPRP